MASIFFIVLSFQFCTIFCSSEFFPGHAYVQSANNVQNHSVNTFNNQYPDDIKAITSKICFEKGEKEIGFLLGTSLSPMRPLQDAYIKEFVGDNHEAQTVFKRIPSSKAVKRGKEAQYIHYGTEKRMPKGEAFLLKKDDRSLCSDIIANTQESETSNGRESIIEVDAATYNKVAYLPPHVKKALGNRHIVVNRTFTEKLTCVGLYCFIGGVTGGIGGAAIGGIKHVPDQWTDILVNNAEVFIKKATSSAVNTILNDHTTKPIYNKIINKHAEISNDLISSFNYEKYSNDHDRAFYEALRSTREAYTETHTLWKDVQQDIQSIPRREKKALSSKIVTRVGLDAANIIVRDEKFFNPKGAWEGAKFGAGIGACVGFAYGCYKSGQPIVKQKISKIGVNPKKSIKQTVKTQQESEFEAFGKERMRPNKILNQKN